MMSLLSQLKCRHCDFQRTLDAAGRLRWLQKAGHLRRTSDPSSPLVDELFHHQLDALVCPDCGRAGFHSSQIDEEEPEQWGERRRCSQCNQPIPAARLELLPNATTCVACQQTNECASVCRSEEHCPRCGDYMVMATRRSSIDTHYLTCKRCGRRDPVSIT